MKPRSRDDFTIAIMCALTLEADAVEALFDEIYDRMSEFYGKLPGDANSYINGRIDQHNVVLCFVPGSGQGRAGKVSAASVTSSLNVSYPSIQLALVVGICGGVPYPSENPEIFLGDVVISNETVEYDFGKQYPGEFQQKIMEVLRKPNRPTRTFLAQLQNGKTQEIFQDQMSQHLQAIQKSDTRWQHPGLTHGIHDVLFEASYHHKHYGQTGAIKQCLCFNRGSPKAICEEALTEDCDSLGCGQDHVSRSRQDTPKPSIHIGRIGCADTVMKSGEHRDKLAQDGKIIGFEMEGPGAWDNVSSCIIIKGVSDYADSHKSKRWQDYAAAVGASAAKALLKQWRPKITNGYWTVPFIRNVDFAGRQTDLNKLEGYLSMSNGPRKLAIAGLGGVGKTQTALELAYRIRERDPLCSIFWISCTSTERIEKGYVDIAQALGQKLKPAEAKEHVNAYLSGKKAGRWLLIFDSVDDMSIGTALKDSLPYSEQGHVLFTTRNRQLAVEVASSYVMPIFKPDERTATEILHKLIAEKSLLDDKDAAVALLKQLAFLPLEIAQAAAYINKNYPIATISSYLQLLREQESERL